ncbi:MAG: hypothetical protein WBM24_23695 [Candidatus Sulfotelmatobacter sp.]
MTRTMFGSLDAEERPERKAGIKIASKNKEKSRRNIAMSLMPDGVAGKVRAAGEFLDSALLNDINGRHKWLA